MGFRFITALLAAGFCAQGATVQEKAVQLLSSGHVDEAIAMLREAVRGERPQPALLNVLGGALCLKNRTEEAVPLFRMALAADPQFTPALKNLAIAEFNLAHLDTAKKLFEQLHRRAAHRQEASLFLGLIAAEQKRDTEALRHLAAAGDLVTTQPRGVIALAGVRHRTGQSEKATETLRQLAPGAPLAERDAIELALLLSAMQRHEEALARIDNVERGQATTPALVRARVDILAAANRAGEAVALARTQARVLRKGALLVRASQIAEASGDIEAAVQSLREAIVLEPTSEDHYLDLSLLCSRFKNNELALEILDIGLRQLPDSYRLTVQRGITLEYSDKHARAKQAFERAMSLTPDHSLALGALGVSQILSDEIDVAVTTLRDGVGRFPDDYYLRYLYGFALERSLATEADSTRITQLAIEAFSSSIERNPNFAQAHYHLGKLLVSRDVGAATKHFEAALRLDANAHAAKYQLARLYLQAGRRQDGMRLMGEVEKAKADKLELEQKPGFVVVKR